MRDDGRKMVGTKRQDRRRRRLALASHVCERAREEDGGIGSIVRVRAVECALFDYLIVHTVYSLPQFTTNVPYVYSVYYIVHATTRM